MGHFDDIATALRQLERWKMQALVAMCVERVAPVFIRLADPKSVKLFRDGLKLLWQAVTEMIPKDRLVRVMASLRNLPEADADDSHLANYYAMLALNTLVDGLELSQNGDEQSAERVCSAALEIRDCFDTLLEAKPGQTWKSDSSTVMPLGSLETEELEVQKQALSIVRDAERPKPELVSSLQTRSQNAAQKIDKAVQEVARRQGWI